MKKDQKNKKCSLRLPSERIRLLSASQLAEAAGGTDSPKTGSNNTCYRQICYTY